MIEIEALSKGYRDFVAVDDLTLVVSSGELYALLGRNGAGKTTTLKCLVGLLRPDAGSIRVGGFDIVATPARAKRLLGYVPDRPFLYEKLTGAEFIGFMAELYGADARAVEQSARRFLELFELAGREQELVESYSYGMRQKLVLISVLARRPPAIVIDEPIVGLDPKAAKTLRELLVEIRDQGTSILMSTHSVQIAELVADRIGIINDGRLIAEGSMEELRRLSALPGHNLEELFLALTASNQQPPVEAHRP